MPQAQRSFESNEVGDDLSEIQVEVWVDELGNVVIEFPEPIRVFAMPAEATVDFANMLIEKARRQ